MKPRNCMRIISTALIAGCSTMYGPDVKDKIPDALPANPRNYTREMGAGNPLALAQLAGAKGFNILFISSDEHNAQMTGYERLLGIDTDIQTPNLDKLASEGVYFANAYSACPLCAPTRASMATGLYPVEHGVLNHNSVMQKQPTWGDFFSAQGYYTGLIGKAHDNNPDYNFGFKYVAKNSGEGKSDALSPPSGLPGPVKDPDDQVLYSASPDKSMQGGVVQNPLQHQDGMVVKLVNEFLAKNKDKKFFLHASLIAPHWPWNSPAEYYYMYDPAKIKMPSNLGPPVDYNPLKVYQDSQWDQLTEAQQRMFRARYMGMLSWMDSNVGQILNKLEELGLKDKTLVIYTTDHGDMASEKGMWFKMVMYEQSARVPLIIRMPGIIKPGSINDTLINHVDYFPTIAGLSGNADSLPGNLTGFDLSAAVLGLTEGPDYNFTVRSTPDKGAVPSVQMVRSHQYKLTRYIGGGSKEFTLYNISDDPYECNNLINDPALTDIITVHKTALTDFMASLRYSELPFVKLGSVSR